MFMFVWDKKEDRIVAVENFPREDLACLIYIICTFVNAVKLIWIRTFKTSTHDLKNVAAAVYPEMLLFGQLGSTVC